MLWTCPNMTLGVEQDINPNYVFVTRVNSLSIAPVWVCFYIILSLSYDLLRIVVTQNNLTNQVTVTASQYKFECSSVFVIDPENAGSVTAPITIGSILMILVVKVLA